jgi:hypothetical protein
VHFEVLTNVMHDVLIYLVSALHVSGLYSAHLQEARVQIGSCLLSPEFGVRLRARFATYFFVRISVALAMAV